MRRYVFRLAVCACTMLGPTLAMGNDQEIARQIVEKLQAEKSNGNLKGFSIDLQVEEGTVWMSGRVASPEHQAKALDIARRIPNVKQVVNDLEVSGEAAAPTRSTGGSALSSMTSAVRNAVTRDDADSRTQQASATEAARPQQSVLSGRSAGAIGTGVAARPVSTSLPTASPLMAQPMPASNYPAHASQVPLAYSQARSVGHEGEVIVGGPGAGGAPVPMYAPGSGAGIAPARYDHPQLPGYAWPTYAAHPNYAAVTYPKQYSPTAWPYIGPFYPYPQVPLGWRKVTLEWDDGWWMLDFKDRRHWSRKW
jgi:hypothetical protein